MRLAGERCLYQPLTERSNVLRHTHATVSSLPTPATNLIESTLRCLPGVGAKTAQRMAFHVLERDRPGARRLAEKLRAATERIGNCTPLPDVQRNAGMRRLCEREPRRAKRCASSRRRPIRSRSSRRPVPRTLFRAARPPVAARRTRTEGTRPGSCSPRGSAKAKCSELIIATNPTVEGEATAHHARADRACRPACARTRLAHGVPLGGELEFVDRGTLAHAFGGRQNLWSGRAASAVAMRRCQRNENAISRSETRDGRHDSSTRSSDAKFRPISSTKTMTCSRSATSIRRRRCSAVHSEDVGSRRSNDLRPTTARSRSANSSRPPCAGPRIKASPTMVTAA